MAEPLELQWLDLVGRPVDDGDQRRHHDIVNAVTAVSLAAALLDDRWDDLDEMQRRELSRTMHARAEQLRRLYH